jgi:hypothetical protein
MSRYTVDEKAMVVGIFLAACVAGIGILQLMAAPSNVNMTAFIWQMITGAMLFNAGVCGVTSIGAMWVNYQAVL